MYKKLSVNKGSVALEADFPNRSGRMRAVSPNRKLATKPDRPEGIAQEEYISEYFRFLSATIIEGHELNISEEVLKKAVKLWEHKPVQIDHRFDVNENVGFTSNPEWDGESDPPGINGWIHVSKKRDEAKGFAISEGLKMGSVAATSVWFYFDWEPSHPEMEEDDFWMLLGQEVEGERVTIRITEITEVWEQTLCLLGADPNARKLSADSKLNKPEQPKNEEKETHKEEHMKEQMIAFLKALGVEVEDNASQETLEKLVAENLETVKTLRRKSEGFDTMLEAVRDKGKSALNALKKAGKEVNPYLEKMLEKDDPGDIEFAATELEKALKDSLPENGRSSKADKLETEPEETPKSRRVSAGVEHL